MVTTLSLYQSASMWTALSASEKRAALFTQNTSPISTFATTFWPRELVGSERGFGAGLGGTTK